LYTNIDDAATATTTGLSLVNPTSTDLSVDLFLIRSDGSTAAQQTIRLSPAVRFAQPVQALFSESVSRDGDYIFVHSSAPIYGIGMVGATNSFAAALTPAASPISFAPVDMNAVAVILSVDPGTDVRPGMTLRVSANVPGDAVFDLSGQPVPTRQLAPGTPTFFVDVPAIEPGFATLRLHNNGLDSPPFVLHILPSDNTPTQNVSGRALYQKIDLGDSGLDLAHSVMVPIRTARVELTNTVSQSTISVSETDDLGRFTIPVTADPDLSIRVISRLRSLDLRVADNTNLNALYTATATLDGRTPPPFLLMMAAPEISGAFNILEMIQRADETLKAADPNIAPPSVSIFWSVRNTNRPGNPALGLIGTSAFNVATNTAYILGDRSTDSDEFDDAVIVHEYGHMLAAKFSRDDSPGGFHTRGDMLDPRIAWSEGWANFFSSVVRKDPIWRDSGPNGALSVRYDLEDNVPPGDHPGYWSEASVGTLLWDLFDDHSDPADDVRYPWSDIWMAFTDLRNDRFVYLPYFLEHFVTRDPSSADPVRAMAVARSIDFQSNLRPSVPNPFPDPIAVSSTVTGTLDSLTTKRSDLINSSHFYSFTTMGGGASIRLDIIGLGPGQNPNANDLDLFLTDVNGHMIGKSDTGLNGQSERIAMRLAEGTYVIEIRSFYTNADTGGTVFDSADYRLNVSIQ
jgi:hypothetical protein